MLIYKISNNVNQRVYIGQTTKTLSERKQVYKNEYKFCKKERPIIAAMRKYGFENFQFEILEDNITTKEELDEKEKFYIKKYKSLCKENGYNVELGGNSFGKHSPEVRKKISEAQLGSKNHMYGKRGCDNPTSKEIIELTTGVKYDSATQAAEALQLSLSHVCSVCRGERGSTGGYVFRYIQNDIIIQPKHFTRIKNLKTKEAVLPEYRYLI